MSDGADLQSVLIAVGAISLPLGIFGAWWSRDDWQDDERLRGMLLLAIGPFLVWGGFALVLWLLMN